MKRRRLAALRTLALVPARRLRERGIGPAPEAQPGPHPPGRAPGPASAGGGRRRRWLRRAAAVVLALLACVSVAAGLLYRSLPKVDDAPARVSRIARLHGGHIVSVPATSRVAQAIVAVEDRRFFSHGAVDFIAIGRVALNTISGASADAGGSTITQQLAKTLYVPKADTVNGRLRAIGLAYKLESRFSKLQILDMYLNAIYFGHGYYGVERASRGYFGRAANQLSWSQASLLAGLPQAPSAYDPFQHLDLARARQREVLQQLVRRGVLSARTAARLAGGALRLARRAGSPAAAARPTRTAAQGRHPPVIDHLYL